MRAPISFERPAHAATVATEAHQAMETATTISGAARMSMKTRARTYRLRRKPKRRRAAARRTARSMGPTVGLAKLGWKARMRMA